MKSVTKKKGRRIVFFEKNSRKKNLGLFRLGMFNT